jgi:3-isopropylmalate dehydratase small subunit
MDAFFFIGRIQNRAVAYNFNQVYLLNIALLLDNRLGSAVFKQLNQQGNRFLIAQNETDGDLLVMKQNFSCHGTVSLP